LAKIFISGVIVIWKKLFGKKPKKEVEEWVEVSPSAFKGEAQIGVRIEKLADFADTERIQQLVRGGSIVFLRVGELRERDVTELKRCVGVLKKTCTAMGGDIVGVDDNFIILTPNFAKIHRGEAS
jgi:SepF-like predicted cell division protein (DUF552 family)